jgi:hypothetical protein
MGGLNILPDQPQTTPPMESPEGLQARLAEALQQRYADPAPSGKWESVPQPAPDLPLEQRQGSQSPDDPLGPLLNEKVQHYLQTRTCAVGSVQISVITSRT